MAAGWHGWKGIVPERASAIAGTTPFLITMQLILHLSCHSELLIQAEVSMTRSSHRICFGLTSLDLAPRQAEVRGLRPGFGFEPDSGPHAGTGHGACGPRPCRASAATKYTLWNGSHVCGALADLYWCWAAAKRVVLFAFQSQRWRFGRTLIYVGLHGCIAYEMWSRQVLSPDS